MPKKRLRTAAASPMFGALSTYANNAPASGEAKRSSRQGGAAKGKVSESKSLSPPKAAFKKLRSRRLFEEVAEQIQSQIGAGVIKIGDRLPAERDLAEQFGVSRPAVREALRSLEIEGLIKLQKGASGGSFVTSGQDGLARSFQTMITIGRLSIEDLAEAREGILEFVVRLAAQRATAADFKLLEQDIERTARHLKESVYLQDPALTQEFYSILARATRNEVVVALIDAMSHMVYKALRPLHVPIYFDIIAFRTGLLKLLKARDEVKAAAALREYLKILQEHIRTATKG